MALMSIGKFAKQIGVTPNHLRIMQKNGELEPAHVSAKGTRYYSDEQLKLFLDKNSTTPREERVIAYCRVSKPSQKDKLETQVANVKSYMYAKGYQFFVITDVGSGVNYKNKGLQELIKLINDGEVDRIVILHKDCLVHFGYDLLDCVCQLNDVKIEIVDTGGKSSEEALCDDLIQIVKVFGNKIYGVRSKKVKALIKGVTDVTRNEDTVTPDT